jgi:hypothetical protein
VLEQLNNLNSIFPSNNENFLGSILLTGKSLDASSGTLHLLTALLTQLIKKMEFCHKKLKNNPPKESSAFFFGQVMRESLKICVLKICGNFRTATNDSKTGF